MHCTKGAKSDVTIYYCSVNKQWDYHHAPGYNDWQATQVGASGTGGHAAATVDDVGGG